MIFYVNVVIFLMMFLIKNKIIMIVTNNWNLDEIHANYQDNILVYFASKELCIGWNVVMDDWYLDEK